MAATDNLRAGFQHEFPIHVPIPVRRATVVDAMAPTPAVVVVGPTVAMPPKDFKWRSRGRSSPRKRKRDWEEDNELKLPAPPGWLDEKDVPGEVVDRREGSLFQQIVAQWNRLLREHEVFIFVGKMAEPAKRARVCSVKTNLNKDFSALCFHVVAPQWMRDVCEDLDESIDLAKFAELTTLHDARHERVFDNLYCQINWNY